MSAATPCPSPDNGFGAGLEWKQRQALRNLVEMAELAQSWLRNARRPWVTPDVVEEHCAELDKAVKAVKEEF
jgi:hypothetical protein